MYWVTSLEEVHWALRRLSRHPRRRLPAILIAACGIAVATVGFSVTYSLFWRPLPFSDPAHIAVVVEPFDVHRRLTTADLDVERSRLDASPMVLAQAHYASGGIFQRADADQGESALVECRVTPDFFRLLGTPAALGRVLNEDDSVDEPSAAVLSYETWRTRFGSDSRILEKIVDVGTHRMRVVGVMPPAFAFPASTKIWTPLRWTYSRPPGFEPWLVRLQPNVTIAQLTSSFPRLDVRPISAAARSQERVAVALLVIGALLVVLVATVQTVALQIAGAMTSIRDAVVKSALGAERARILAGFVLDAVVSTLVSVLLAWSIVPMMTVWIGLRLPPEVLRGQSVVTDKAAFLFSCVVAGVVILVAAVIIQRLVDQAALVPTSSGVASDRRWRHLTFRLVTSQVFCTTTLLYLTGVAAHSLIQFSRADLGFDADHTLIVEVPDLMSLTIGPERALRLDETRRQLDHLPSVLSTARGSTFPLSKKAPLRGTAKIIGDTSGIALSVRVNFVSPEFLDVLNTKVIEGTPFLESTDRSVAIVNRTLARQVAPRGSVLGQLLQVTGNQARIIGVADDFVDSAPNVPTDPQAFFLDPADAGLGSTILVRFRGNAEDAAGLIKARLESAGGAPIRIRPLRDYADAASAPYRGRSVVLEWMAVVGLIIATVGLAASLSLSVRQQTREIALRFALGAERRSVRRLVFRQTFVLLAAGTAAGLLIGMLSARLVRGVLFRVSPADVTTIGAVLAVTFVIAAVAALVPAERAARIDPVTVLKDA